MAKKKVALQSVQTADGRKRDFFPDPLMAAENNSGPAGWTYGYVFYQGQMVNGYVCHLTKTFREYPNKGVIREANPEVTVDQRNTLAGTADNLQAGYTQLVEVGKERKQLTFRQRGADLLRGFVRRDGVTIAGRVQGKQFFADPKSVNAYLAA